MPTKYISSNNTDVDGVWHIAKLTQVIGPRTGKVLHTFYATACTGKTPSGPWGATTVEALQVNARFCKRCAKLVGTVSA